MAFFTRKLNGIYTLLGLAWMNNWKNVCVAWVVPTSDEKQRTSILVAVFVFGVVQSGWECVYTYTV